MHLNGQCEDLDMKGQFSIKLRVVQTKHSAAVNQEAMKKTMSGSDFDIAQLASIFQLSWSLCPDLGHAAEVVSAILSLIRLRAEADMLGLSVVPDRSETQNTVRNTK